MTLEERIEQEKLQIEENREKLAYAVTLDNQYAFDAYMQNIEEHEQLAEWLEELKEYKKNQHRSLRHMYEKGYNKAIDDMHKEIIAYNTYDYCGNVIDVLEIAERLKAGESDGQERV